MFTINRPQKPTTYTKRMFYIAGFMLCHLYTMAQHVTIKVSGTRLVYPVMNRWLEEYCRENPGVAFVLDDKLPADSADIMISAFHIDMGSLKKGQSSITAGKYIQLPIANSNKTGLEKLLTSGLNDQEIKNIYFKNDLASNTGKYSNLFTVYTREKPACAAVSFARHFGANATDLYGVGVKGDDRTLLEAVQKDSNAISYNNLGFVYDTNTRLPIQNITIIPVDLNGNGKIDDNEKHYATLDEVISFAEQTSHPKLVIEDVNLVYSTSYPKPVVTSFLRWVLKDGQKFNHQYGFINASDTSLEDQIAILNTTTQAFDLDSLYRNQ